MTVGFRIESKVLQGAAVIEVSGNVGDLALVELEQLCRKTLGHLTLDLTHVQSIETEGVRFIQELEAKGVPVVGGSPYLRLLLR